MRIDITIDTEKNSDLVRAQQLIAMLSRQGGQESGSDPEELPFMREYGEQEQGNRAYEIPDSIEDEPAAPVRQMSASRQSKAVEVPAGQYLVCLHDLIIEQAKSGKEMAVFDFTITSGRFAKRHIFMRQVFSGTKNDSRCIAGIEGIIDKMMQATGGRKIAWRGASAGQIKGFADALAMEKIPFNWDKAFEIGYDPSQYTSTKIL